MKKIIFYLLLAGISTNCFGMNNNKKTYLMNLQSPSGEQFNIKITSFFDLSKNPEAVQKAIMPNVDSLNKIFNHDLTDLETATKRLAQANRTFVQRNRGKIGFCAGVVTGMALVSIPLIYVLSHFPTFKK